GGMPSAGARSVVSLEPEADGSSHHAAATIEKHARALGLDGGRWSVRRETLQSFQPDRPFRAILSQDSVNHLDEDACVRLLDDPSARRSYRDLFARMADMLEPGGHVVLADCARVNNWAWMGRHAPWQYNIEWHKHHEPETWAAVLAEAGLEPAKPVWWQ